MAINGFRTVLDYWHSEEKTKEFVLFFSRFFVTLLEIAFFLYIKTVWGIEGKWGNDLDTVLNSTFCYKLLNALGFAASLVEEHPTLSHQPFYDSSSGAKVIISFESSK